MSGSLRHEFESVTKYQQSMHTASKDKGIASAYRLKQQRVTWTTASHEKVNPGPPVETEDGVTVSFVFDNSKSVLVESYSTLVLPKLKVKKKHREAIQICWKHNSGINCIAHNAFIKNSEEPTQSFDSDWVDCYNQRYLRISPELHDVRVGNIAELEQWNTHLPAYRTYFDQPWWYSEYPDFAYPLFLLGPTDKVRQDYVLRNNITDLLRMRKLVDGKWVEVPPNLKYLDGIKNEGKLPIPELWVRYGKQTPKEMDQTKCDIVEGEYNEIFYHDVVAFDPSTEGRYGDTLSAVINCDYPCNSIFWALENIGYPSDDPERSSVIPLSNYTTDESDVYSGAVPWDNLNLDINGNNKFRNMKHGHFTLMDVNHHRSSPMVRGWGSWSWSDSNLGIDVDPGMVLKGTTLSVKVTDGTLRFDEGKSDSDSDHEGAPSVDPRDDVSVSSRPTEGGLTHPRPSEGGLGLTHTRQPAGSRSKAPAKVGPTFKLHVRLLVTKKLIIRPQEGGGYQITVDVIPPS